MPARLTFPRSRRLTRDLEFQAVYGARMKKARPPLVVFSKPNERAFHRLGLSVGKRVGGAVQRNRVKRLIREAFRIEQHALELCGGAGLDMIVSASAGAAESLTLDAARTIIRDLVSQSGREWEKRLQRK